MSRAALNRQEANVQERKRQAEEAYRLAIDEGRSRQRSAGVLPLVGPDDTFNINPMLLHNISVSPYFYQKCYGKIKDWNALVDEIYYEVKHLEPWTPGSKTPSTAFCLLVRLFTLRCTEKQIQLMLDHVDSPYIRCIGFLYLRYAVEPSLIFSYMEPYLYDDEPVQICANARPEGTVGEFVRQLLKSMDYYGTLLPRLPVQIERDVKAKLVEAEGIERRAKANLADRAKMEHFRRVGSAVRALYGDEENPVTWYDAVVDRVLTHDDATGELLARPKFIVTFPEYGNTETVRIGEIDLRQGSGGGGSSAGGDDDYGRGRADWDRGNDHRGRGRDSYYDDRDRGRGRERDRYREDDRRDRGYGGGGGGGGRRNEDDRWRRDRYERDDGRVRGYERSRSRSRDRYGGSRERSPPRSSVSNTANAAAASSANDPPRQEEKRREKTPEELAAIQEKKKKLMAKYG